MKRRNLRIITLAADIAILALSFVIVVLTKPSSLKGYLPSHWPFFSSLVVIWIVVSLLNGKMHRGKIVSYETLISRVLSSNIIAIAITALLMYSLRDYHYSRTIVLGTALAATILELAAGALFLSYKKANLQEYEEYDKYKKYRKPNEYELVAESNGKSINNKTAKNVNPGIITALEKECGKQMAEAVVNMTGHNINGNTAVLSTTTAFNISCLPQEKYSYIINLRKLNDIVKLDEFIDEVNRKLEFRGYFFCCVETKDQRKERFLKSYPPVLNYIYYTLDFIVKRVLPKLKITRPLYFFITGGKNAVISRAEVLGRLSRGGFRIRLESFISDYLCIEAMKLSDPVPISDYKYGPLIALPRIGKNGRTIKVYKFRTMHPYSEYIQDYVYRLYDLGDGGKFRNDFRITTWGGICRKIWLDELPMLINLLRGDMKLVGVRPLSRHYFELYTKELRERRINYKPGLIPPFYAHMPSDLEGIQASENRYFDEYDQHPFITDFRYFWKSVWNILIRKARSN